jgi:DNA-binding NarL/FixJ family response regulator
VATTSDRARAAFDQHDWTEAYRLLSAPGGDGQDPVDLERLAVAAYLVGDDGASTAAWERAHRGHLRKGSTADAASCAFWLALVLLLQGESARAGGWLARAGRIVEESELDCAVRGYLLIPRFLQARGAGEVAECEALAAEVRRVGRSFDDPDLVALGTLAEGQAALAAGRIADALALLDETMVGLAADDVSPIPTGIIYCAVIESCMAIHDLRRAAEWTEALRTWCDEQPGLVPYRGQCLVHRSQILLQRGDWPAALTEARRAEELLTDPPHPALGLAFYQQAEVQRRRGDFDDAERAYRAASRHGHPPEPGLALLLLARGEPEAAAAMVRRALDDLADPLERPARLAAMVDVMRERGDIETARDAADELASIAAEGGASVLHAMARHAAGAVLLAEGDPSAALTELRAAADLWLELDVPYETARTRTLAGVAHAAIGDRVSAELELEAAHRAFAALGAAPDVARVEAFLERGSVPPASRLTARERQVLRAVAGGRTNREVAEELVISEHTVARHLQNIFTKIDVRSRAAATAYAYEHHVL